MSSSLCVARCGAFVSHDCMWRIALEQIGFTDVVVGRHRCYCAISFKVRQCVMAGGVARPRLAQNEAQLSSIGGSTAFFHLTVRHFTNRLARLKEDRTKIESPITLVTRSRSWRQTVSWLVLDRGAVGFAAPPATRLSLIFQVSRNPNLKSPPTKRTMESSLDPVT